MDEQESKRPLDSWYYGRLLDDADYVSELINDVPAGFLWSMLNDIKATLYDIDQIVNILKSEESVSSISMADYEASLLERQSIKAPGDTVGDWLARVRYEVSYVNAWMNVAVRYAQGFEDDQETHDYSHLRRKSDKNTNGNSDGAPRKISRD